MELRLEPYRADDQVTISELFLEPAHRRLCFVLEDAVREIPGRPVAEWKIAGKTAIPAGRYRIVITRSNRFSALASAKAGHPVDVLLPQLLTVPGYDGVRIHCGNRPEDTEGCLLPGARAGADVVLESRPAFEALKELLAAELARPGSEVWITITRLERRDVDQRAA